MSSISADFKQILDAVEGSYCVPFVGDGGGVGAPDTQELVAELAENLDLSGSSLELRTVAQRYIQDRGRNELCRKFESWLHAPDVRPGPLHHLIAQLPFRFIFTIAQHQLLERALEDAGYPVSVVVSQQDTAYIDSSAVTVVKLKGDVSQPKSMVLTEKDHLTFLDDSPLIADLVTAKLAENTLLFLGYDLSDREINQIILRVVKGQGKHKRSAYAVLPDPGEDLRLFWADENLRFVDEEPVTFLQRLHRELSDLRQASESALPTVSQPPVPTRPFRFLDAYRLEDAKYFAGRDLEIENLSQKILAHRLVVLTGASGSGKTSLLQAGVYPRLGANRWRLLHVRPLGDPLGELQRALASVAGEDASAAILPEMVIQAETTVEERLVVILDQFEEFFRQSGAEARNTFMTQFAPCLSDPEIDTRFVLSLRDDYFLRLGELEDQVPAIFRNVFVLNRLTPEQALVAILEPLRQAGIEIEGGLPEQIVRDLDDSGVNPPQLQIVCDRLYDDMLAQGGTEITQDDYTRLGGIERILPGYLSDVLVRLPQAKPVLEALVGDGGLKVTRSIMDIEERLSGETEDMPEVLEKLIDARLVRAIPVGQSIQYELVHDVLAASIWEWFSEGAKEAERARGVLNRGLSDWQVSSDALFDAQRLDFIAERWTFLGRVQSEIQGLLLRSAVVLGRDVMRWLDRITDATLIHAVILEMSSYPDPAVRQRTMGYLTDIAGTADDPGIVLETLRRSAVKDPNPDVRRAATLALYRLQGDPAITYLVDQTRGGDVAIRPRAVDDLAILGDGQLPIWSHLSGGLRLRVAAGVARLRLQRHWPLWGWRVVGATAGGALGLSIGFATQEFVVQVIQLVNAKPSLDLGLVYYLAIYVMVFGAIGGFGCGLGIALSAALSDRDNPVARAAGGLIGGSLGYAVGLQMMQSAIGLSAKTFLWSIGLLVGALIGSGVGLSLISTQRTGLQVLGGAVGGALGFGVASFLGLPWSPILALLTGAMAGGMVGAGLVWADRRS